MMCLTYLRWLIMNNLLCGNISLQLANIEHYDLALRMASSMPEMSVKYMVLSNIAFMVAQRNGAVARILAIVERITSLTARSITLDHISNELALAGRLSDARQIANTIPESERKALTLERISEIAARAWGTSSLFPCFGL